MLLGDHVRLCDLYNGNVGRTFRGIHCGSSEVPSNKMIWRSRAERIFLERKMTDGAVVDVRMSLEHDQIRMSSERQSV